MKHTESGSSLATDFRRFTALLLVLVLSAAPATASPRPPQPDKLDPAVFAEFRSAIAKSYLQLFDEAATLEFSKPQIEAMREYLEDAGDYCVRRYRDRARGYSRQIEEARAKLKRDTATLGDDARKEQHCHIQNLQLLESQDRMLAQQAIPVAYENRRAKLDLIEKWPSELKRIQAETAAGTHHSRKWGDVKDIGVRELVAGQEQDVKLGQDAVNEMKQARLLPPELDSKQVTEYVNRIAQRIAERSDLRVPLTVTVLDSKEVNAFALPGGFIFIERGLIEAAEDESQLAGVIAHEIAHVTARHGNRLMKRGTISSILYQAAQVAAIVLTGGVAGIGTAYALQYGFYGLGLVLNLDLLGVSRDFEMEADQLGIQYAWNAGYDPDGFIRFFDKMATRAGYVNSASWFRTHPPFFQRMVNSKQEIMYLPAKGDLITQTTEFDAIKKALAERPADAKKNEGKRPSLFGGAKIECPAPQKDEFKPGEQIESLCEIPMPEKK